ncbi:unnamed protein product [Cylindrotheca closterium]|uniref:Protein kinase domain-containing protein n=1 Tax=Cylindrotheca closterium TaxID=2856 RepID=A0AAD2G1T8_9STRA|nr:unnamed protein product [Cylindrotheca closterium]
MCQNSNSAFSDSTIDPLVLRELERYDDLSPQHNDVVMHQASDIQRVSLLGKGSYCDVFLVILRSTKEHLAMKKLDKKKIGSQQDFLAAAPDLIIEAHYLSKLDHPNVIKLRGVSSLPFSESFTQDKNGYFMTMDVMEETLEDRLHRWRKDPSCYTQRRGICSQLIKKAKKKLDVPSMYGRLETVALGIVDAMEYIHGQCITVNDLKPANIGFHGETGNVCLFDFGFARDLAICPPDEIYGTPRYMAPEVLKGEGYSLKSDVYSFGVMLHEVTSLCKREGSKKVSVENHSDLMVICESLSELSLHNIPCRRVTALIEICLSDDPERRPSFECIGATLRAILTPDTTTKLQTKLSLISETDASGTLPDLDTETFGYRNWYSSPLKDSLQTESNSTLDTLPECSINEELSTLRNVEW